jgi:hypothetical protein
MARRSKLQYAATLTLAGFPGGVNVVRCTANPVLANDGVGVPGVNGADADRYGNVLTPIAFAGAGVLAAAKNRQAVKAWFQASSAAAFVVTGETPSTTFLNVCVDFIAPTNVGAYVVAPAIDPATVLRPWLRVKIDAVLTGGGLPATDGVIFIEAKHSVEV